MTDAHEAAKQAIEQAFAPFGEAITAAREDAERRVREIETAADELHEAQAAHAAVVQAIEPLASAMSQAQLRGDDAEVDELRKRYARLNAELDDLNLRVAEAEERYRAIAKQPYLVWSGASIKVESVQREAWELRDELLQVLRETEELEHRLEQVERVLATRGGRHVL